LPTEGGRRRGPAAGTGLFEAAAAGKRDLGGLDRPAPEPPPGAPTQADIAAILGGMPKPQRPTPPRQGIPEPGKPARSPQARASESATPGTPAPPSQADIAAILGGMPRAQAPQRPTPPRQGIPEPAKRPRREGGSPVEVIPNVEPAAEPAGLLAQLKAAVTGLPQLLAGRRGRAAEATQGPQPTGTAGRRRQPQLADLPGLGMPEPGPFGRAAKEMAGLGMGAATAGGEAGGDRDTLRVLEEIRDLLRSAPGGRRGGGSGATQAGGAPALPVPADRGGGASEALAAVRGLAVARSLGR
jgi:hypothetical protein